MSSDQLKTFAWAAALAVTSCGGPTKTAPHAPDPVEPQPARAPSASGLGHRRDRDEGGIDPSKTKERLPPEFIQAIVRANFGLMLECYQEGLRRDPALKGTIAVKFVIGRDGTVSTAAQVQDTTPGAGGPSPLAEMEMAEIAAPRFPDPKVTECVVARFAQMRFPPPQGGIVTVIYPVVFSPGE